MDESTLPLSVSKLGISLINCLVILIVIITVKFILNITLCGACLSRAYIVVPIPSLL